MKKLISRRNFLKVCALAGSAAALSACGGGKSTGGSNSAAAAVDTTGAVTFPLSEKVTFTGMTSFPVGSESEPNNRRPMCTSTGPPSSPTSGTIRSP